MQPSESEPDGGGWWLVSGVVSVLANKEDLTCLEDYYYESYRYVLSGVSVDNQATIICQVQ